MLNHDAVLEVCGFGPVVSGIRTSQLIGRHQPARCLLLGIAGSFREALTIGTAHVFSRISCYGIGAGSGSAFRSSEELRWPLWPDPDDLTCGRSTLALSDFDATSDHHLLTVCAASGDQNDADERRCRFPDVAAEDMEAFAVALACLSCGIPLTVIRGISNTAGDRDKSHWDIPSALQAVARLAGEVIKSKTK